MVWYENKRYTHRPMGQNWEPRNKHIQRELKVKVKVKSLSRVRLFATPWTVAYQAPPSMGFSRQEYWSGLSFPSPRDLPDPGIKPGSPEFQANALTSEPPGKQIIWKDPDAGKDWGQEEKRVTEDEIVGWHHWLHGHGFAWTLGVGDGQGAWRAAIQGVAKSQTRLSNWTELKVLTINHSLIKS